MYARAHTHTHTYVRTHTCMHALRTLYIRTHARTYMYARNEFVVQAAHCRSICPAAMRNQHGPLPDADSEAINLREHGPAATRPKVMALPPSSCRTSSNTQRASADRHGPPDPTEPGVKGAYIIIGRAVGQPNMCAANISGHDELGRPYSIDVVLQRTGTSLSGARGNSRVLDKVHVKPRRCLLELVDAEGGTLVHAAWHRDMPMTQVDWL